jgi:hypothetical protein
MSPTVRKDCPCPNVSCKHHTLCDECEAEQVLKGKLPFCRRPKRSLWRRIRKIFGLSK